MSLLGYKETMDEATKDIAKYKKKIEKIQEKIKELENIRELCEKKLSEKPRDNKSDLRKLKIIAWKVLHAYSALFSSIRNNTSKLGKKIHRYAKRIKDLLEPIYTKIEQLLDEDTKFPIMKHDDNANITGIDFDWFHDNHIDDKKISFTKKDWEERGDRFVKELEQELSTF